MLSLLSTQHIAAHLTPGTAAVVILSVIAILAIMIGIIGIMWAKNKTKQPASFKKSQSRATTYVMSIAQQMDNSLDGMATWRHHHNDQKKTLRSFQQGYIAYVYMDRDGQMHSQKQFLTHQATFLKSAAQWMKLSTVPALATICSADNIKAVLKDSSLLSSRHPANTDDKQNPFSRAYSKRTIRYSEKEAQQVMSLCETAPQEHDNNQADMAQIKAQLPPCPASHMVCAQTLMPGTKTFSHTVGPLHTSTDIKPFSLH